jgi:DNA-binding CsgD family transcriptional regulator
MQLGQADLRAVLDFLADVDDLDDEAPYSAALLGHLGRLVPNAVASYQEADLCARRFVTIISDDREDDDGDDLYWALGPCPIADYRARTGDLTSIRMSDVIGRTRWHDLSLYREYFRPFAIESAVDLGLEATRGWSRSVVLLRERDDPDFSDRDRAVLESLRPHLRAREARAALRHALLVAPLSTARWPDDSEPQLTARQREIISLVADGKTNAEIAAVLWVTPATVKKHLETVYERLGVGNRAAAAAVAQGRAPAQDLGPAAIAT